MIRPLTLALLLLAPVAASAEGLPQTLTENLDGWSPSAHPECWSIDGGVLSLKNDPGREGSTLWTERDYGDFILELEFKFGEGTIDSGVFVRQENDQIQIGESGSLKRDLTASPYINGEGYPIEATGVAEVLRPDGWNAMKIVAVGDDYDVWLNGQHVTHFRSDTAIERGPVGIQLHPQREMTMQYRNIRLAELQ